MPAQKTAKITVLLEQEEFERFEAYCDENGFKKSTLIARLIRDHLDAQHYQSQRPLSFTPLGKRVPQEST